MTIKHVAHYYHCQLCTASNLLASDKNSSTYEFRLIIKVDLYDALFSILYIVGRGGGRELKYTICFGVNSQRFLIIVCLFTVF